MRPACLRPFSGPAGACASSGVVELQPNAGAPLLRNEKAWRSWLEKELEVCNQSYEYRWEWGEGEGGGY